MEGRSDVLVQNATQENSAGVEKYKYITVREVPAIKQQAAESFHSKWGVAVEAYLECIDAYLKHDTEYGWYLCLAGEKIVGGLGVIENHRPHKLL